MNARRWWIGIIGGGVAAAAGIGTMIYLQYGKIAEARTEVATLKSSIESSSKLIEGTAAMEREVIVLREISEVMKQILPDNDDVNNLVRTLQKFSEDSEVRISGLKKKNADARDKSEFDKVAYTLSLEGDAFQLLGFLNLIEGHSRFMRVPNFRITAAQRSQLEASGVPAHKVQVDVETYVYDPQKDSKAVKIDSYDRKRDLLMGEINRRRLGLSLSTYSYRGARGRRDPWIDPRVPVLGEDVTALSVQQQMDMVQGLADRTQQALGKWEQIKQAENVIVEMMTRSELEELMSGLEEEIRRLEAENSIRYVPSQRRLQTEVIDILTDLRTQLVQSDAGRGPSEKMLREVEETMVHHQERSEYKLMLDAFALVENQLALVETDPLRKPLSDRVKGLALEAKTVIDFEKIQLKIGGRAIIEGLPATVVINGKPLGEGDMLNNELVVHAIRKDEIEFMFRGFIFAWRF